MAARDLNDHRALQVRQPGQRVKLAFLDEEEAKAWMQRELDYELRWRHIKSIEYDVDGIGFIAVSFHRREVVEWHNNAYTLDRFVAFNKCLNLYPRDRVISAFGRYPHHTVRRYAEAVGRMIRIAEEERAAEGDRRAARGLGLIQGDGSFA